MSQDACPLPLPPRADQNAVIQRMLQARRIAIVGLSDDPMRPSYSIAEYLQLRGYKIIPVNPNHSEVLGEKCYPSLSAAPKPIEIVNVFRRPLFCAQVTQEAIAIGAKGVWLQSGIINDEARDIAEKAGIDFIQNRCIMVEHRVRGLSPNGSS